ncbi:MAG: hypothetical protein A3F67_06115 [Verrucomicrobia bacterium RIFCSPHIGHO2_12_FULL_41_10]|nr:MAG: hypothetical protein A3F67_06115 [Verrucomicrobia bacterium RIFCSPHIGHO2_12_FULL_41_10]HLB33821.1 hypothetical protein [Chthoniobacterales bacterium]
MITPQSDYLIQILPPQEGTLNACLEGIASYYGVEFSRDHHESHPEEGAGLSSGFLEFSKSNGNGMRFILEQEEGEAWSSIRATAIFGDNTEEKTWGDHPEFLEAFLLGWIVPGSLLPVAPALLPDGTLQFQLVAPWSEQTQELLISFISIVSSFYQKAVEFLREVSFGQEFTRNLKEVFSVAGAVWSLGEWERQKTLVSDAQENYSEQGHYYRLISSTAVNPGMLAVNLGNISEFIGFKKIIPQLLNVNAFSFLSDNYYIGVDDRQGVLLMALLPPSEERERKQRIDQLLQRSVAVRDFINKITNQLEAIHIQEALKDVTEVESLLLP